MKKYIMILLLLFGSCNHSEKILVPPYSFENWQLISTSNTEGYFRKIFFINQQTGWVIGDNGVILRTVDGGFTWNHQESNTSKNLASLFFVNENKGWITGLNNTFLFTLNSGATWQQIYIYDDSLKHNTDICFVNEKIGWFINNYGEIFKTTDGGTTWNELFTFPNLGWSKIKFLDNLYGYALQFYGSKLMITEDGGQTWRTIQLSIPDAKLSIMVRDIQFIDQKTGFYIYSWCSGGIMETATPVMKTDNGGATWTFQDSIMVPTLHVLNFFDESNGMLAGSHYIYKTNDAGANWDCIASFEESNYFISDIFFYENKIGWALGSNGTIYKTINK